MLRQPFMAAARFAAAALLLVTFALPAMAETVSLTSLEWPPYTGENLAEGGASAKIAREAFKAMGYDLEIKFLPWSRAVATAKSDKNFIGYFPEYFAESIEADFLFSERMGDSPLGFVESSSAPVAWDALTDLKGKPIGTVQGYVNTADFDAMTASGELTAEPVTDDATNIRKVQGGRVPLAVIDKNVLTYMLATDPKLDGSKVQFNNKLLENKGLFICFRKDADGEQMAKIFNEGLAKIDWKSIQDEYMTKAIQ